MGTESVWLDADRTRAVAGAMDGLNAAWGLTDSIVGMVESGQSLVAANAELDAMRSLADRPASTTSIDWARGGGSW